MDNVKDPSIFPKIRKYKEKIASLIITLLITYLLMFSGPVSAINVGITDIAGNADEDSTVSFLAKVDLHTDDILLEDSNFTVTMNTTEDEPSYTCTFNLTGDNLTSCSNINITRLHANLGTRQYGYGYGYGYGFDFNTSTYSTKGTNFTGSKEYGYAYSSGYGYDSFSSNLYTGSSSGKAELIYNITWTAPSVSSNTDYTVGFSALVTDDGTNKIRYEAKGSYEPTIQINNKDSFYGYVKYANGTAANNVNVSFNTYSGFGDSPDNVYKTTTSSDGFFNISDITIGSNQNFDVSTRIYNSSNPNRVNYVGPSLPPLPYAMMSDLKNMSFYLKEGATINISAVDETGSMKKFEFYQVKDKSLGFPVKDQFSDTMFSNFTAYVPANRSYTVMIYPNQSLPISVDVNPGNLTDDGYFNYTFNTSESRNSLTGYVNTTSGMNFTSLYATTVLLEPGRMIYFGDFVSALFNISSSNPDSFNTTSGFYNITVPGTPENTTAVVFYTGFNNSGDGKYYGGWKAVTLAYDDPDPTQLNVTLREFRGNVTKNLSVMSIENPSSGISAINYTAYKFNLQTAAGATVNSPHVEVSLDYDSLNMTNFTLMIPSSGNIASFYVPLLKGVGVKEMNIFSRSGAPMQKKISSSNLDDTNFTNLTLKSAMNMTDPDGDSLGNIYVDMIKSNSECNVPNYNETECSLLDGLQQVNSSFDPDHIVMSGATMSFVMKNENNITVIYKNVDMLASGPPDSQPDSDSSDTAGTSTFEQAWKFGSTGPDIYDEVIIGIPYTEGDSSSQTGFNESAQMNMTIPKLYNETYGVVWNSSAGDNTTNITSADPDDELSDFSDYVGEEYEGYLNGSYPACNASDENLTAGLCYKDTTNNMLWFKIPHFSGVGATPTGSVIKYSAPSTEDGGDGGDGEDGAGGGVSTGTATTAFVYLGDLVEAGDSVNMNISEFDFTGVVLSATNDLLGTFIDMETVDRPDDVDVPPDTAYGYYYFRTNLEDDDVEDGTLDFRIPASWYTNNSLDPETTTLLRWHDGEWQEIDTTLTDSDDDYYYFEASVPGFSYFTVTAQTPPECGNDLLETGEDCEADEGCETGDVCLNCTCFTPATFQLSNLRLPSAPEPNEQANIMVDVENLGDLEGEHTITLKIDNEVENTEQVTLKGGKTETVTFSISKPEGSYSVRVDGLTGSFEVKKSVTKKGNWWMWVKIGLGLGIVIVALVLFYFKYLKKEASSGARGRGSYRRSSRRPSRR